MELITRLAGEVKVENNSTLTEKQLQDLKEAIDGIVTVAEEGLADMPGADVREELRALHKSASVFYKLFGDKKYAEALKKYEEWIADIKEDEQ